MLDDGGETNAHPADEETSMNEETSDTSTEQQPRKYLNDDELWKIITAYAEERSGDYVTHDDLEL